jgi:WD40 repeat protein
LSADPGLAALIPLEARMGSYERRFVRPSFHDLVAALDEATALANQADNLLALDHDHWAAFVADIRTEPEGVRQWAQEVKYDGPSAVVGLAWWTDALSRRHFRVWAGSAADESYAGQMVPGLDSETPAWAPVWHIGPDRVVARTVDGRRDWLALCPCGACGEPAAIGWTGDRCGACHERGHDSTVAVFSEMHQRIDHLVFSPDSRYLAAAGAGRLIRLWDVKAREARAPLYPPHAEIRAMTFAPGSRLLAVASGDRMLRFIDVETREEEIALLTPGGVHLVAIAADDLTMVMGGEKETEVWGRADWSEPWRLLHSQRRPATAVWFSPSCDDLVMAWDDYLGRWSLNNRGVAPRQLWGQVYPGKHFVSVACRRGEDYLAAVSFDARSRKSASLDTGAVCLRPVRLSDGQRTGWSFDLRYLSSRPCLAPDGSWFAGPDGSFIVLQSTEESGQECHLAPGPRPALTALAFSPDGHTLAVAAANGTIRLWPWRRLLVA